MNLKPLQKNLRSFVAYILEFLGSVIQKTATRSLIRVFKQDEDGQASASKVCLKRYDMLLSPLFEYFLIKGICEMKN